MALAARELGWGEMLYLARPRKQPRRVRDVARLVAELAQGDKYILQPWYRGKRAVWRPDLSMAYSSSGKPIRNFRATFLLPHTWAPLDLFISRGTYYVLDVMLPQTFKERADNYSRIKWSAVRGYQQVNEILERQLARPDASQFNGVVLKRIDTRYPWLPAGQQVIDGWWHITRPM